MAIVGEGLLFDVVEVDWEDEIVKHKEYNPAQITYAHLLSICHRSIATDPSPPSHTCCPLSQEHGEQRMGRDGPSLTTPPTTPRGYLLFGCEKWWKRA